MVRSTKKPLLGFGPFGWIASAILATMLVMLWIGVDFQYQFIWLLTDAFGSPFVMWYVPRVHSGYWLSLFSPWFGPIGACIVLSAMFIHPRQSKLWMVLAVIAWALIRPAIWQPACWFVMNLWRQSIGEQLSLESAVLITGVLAEAITSILLGLATGSRRILLIHLGSAFTLHPVLWWMQNHVTGLSGFEIAQEFIPMVVWNLVLATLVMTWAVHGWWCQVEVHECSSCGYDLRGAPHERCPECGMPVSAAPAGSIPQNQPV